MNFLYLITLIARLQLTLIQEKRITYYFKGFLDRNRRMLFRHLSFLILIVS